METPDSPDIKEKDLAAQLQVDRSVLTALRKQVLVEGEDYRHEVGFGIVLTAAGQQKIKGALPQPDGPPPAQDPAEAAPTRDIVIRRLLPNPRVVEGVSAPGEGRVMVKLGRGPSPHYRPGMTLPACIKVEQAELWEYTGPRPRRPGQF